MGWFRRKKPRSAQGDAANAASNDAASKPGTSKPGVSNAPDVGGSVDADLQRRMNEGIKEFSWQRPGEASVAEWPFELRLDPAAIPRRVRWNPVNRFIHRRDRSRLVQINVWAWIACISPYDRSVLVQSAFGKAPGEHEPIVRELGQLEEWIEYALYRQLCYIHSDHDPLAAMAAKHCALVAAKRLGDTRLAQVDPTEEQAAAARDARGIRGLIRRSTTGLLRKSSPPPRDPETRLEQIFWWIHFAIERRAQQHGSYYGSDYCFILELLCGETEKPKHRSQVRLFGAPPVSKARFAGRRVKFCERSLAFMRDAHGVGSQQHRWMLAWCVHALIGEAKSEPATAEVRDRWIEELLELERKAPPVAGMIHLGSAVLMAAEDAKGRGDLARAERILREGARDMEAGSAGLPTRYQSVRKELLALLDATGRTQEVEALLRDMIRVEEHEHTPDALPLRTMMGPAIGWLRVRLARMLERQGRIEEAEQCYRAAIGDRFGMRPPWQGVAFLAQFLARQQRAVEAIAAIDEMLRRTRAAAQPNEHMLMGLLMMRIDTIDRTLDRTDPVWKERIEASVDALMPMLRAIVLEPPHYFGSDTLVQGAYMISRAGHAEAGLELLRPHMKGSESWSDAERESRTWLVAMYSFCLEFLGEQLGESLSRQPGDAELAERIAAIHRERREHLARVVPNMIASYRTRASPWVDHAQRSLADAMSEEGDHEAARVQLEEALARSKRAVPPSPRMTWMIGRALIDVLEKLHRFDEVMLLRERFPDHGPTGIELVDGDPDLDERDESIGDGESTDGSSGGEDSDGDDGDIDHGDPDEPGRV